MRIRSLAGLVVMSGAVAACSAAKEQGMEQRAGEAPGAGAVTPAAPAAPAAPDSTSPDSAGRGRAATAGAGASSKAPAKAEGPMRDSAFGPKFAVDSTGKVVPIKPPR